MAIQQNTNTNNKMRKCQKIKKYKLQKDKISKIYKETLNNKLCRFEENHKQKNSPGTTGKTCGYFSLDTRKK